jgi:glycosyltransferase involved in cell wall biosynthesis
MLANLDVGLVPLIHSRFNQAKSWCKGLEYGAMGVPAVASPSREYRRYIRPGDNGLLVRKNNWAAQIETILDDLDGYQARARQVAERYWIDDWIHLWVRAYSEARVVADAS